MVRGSEGSPYHCLAYHRVYLRSFVLLPSPSLSQLKFWESKDFVLFYSLSYPQHNIWYIVNTQKKYLLNEGKGEAEP